MGKLKNIILIFMVLSLLMGCTNSVNKTNSEDSNNYASTAYITGVGIQLTVIQNIELCKSISEVWSDAISNGKDFNEEIATVQKIAKETNFLQKLQKDKELIDGMMSRLNNPPEEYKTLYDKLLSLYGQYTKIYELAISPSGSLMTYNQSISEVSSEINRLYNEFQVLVPQDIKANQNSN